MGEPQDSQVVVVEPARVPAVRAVADAHGVHVTEIPRHGIEPVVTVTLSLVGAATTLAMVVERIRGGQVIDLRPNARRTMYRSPRLEYGLILVLSADRRVTVLVKRPDGMFKKVLDALPEVLSRERGAGQVVEALTGRFGDDVEIASTERPDGDGGGDDDGSA